jgi:hypothetical protein
MGFAMVLSKKWATIKELVHKQMTKKLKCKTTPNPQSDPAFLPLVYKHWHLASLLPEEARRKDYDFVRYTCKITKET